VKKGKVWRKGQFPSFKGHLKLWPSFKGHIEKKGRRTNTSFNSVDPFVRFQPNPSRQTRLLTAYQLKRKVQNDDAE
jgi:hypothetical protein